MTRETDSSKIARSTCYRTFLSGALLMLGALPGCAEGPDAAASSGDGAPANAADTLVQAVDDHTTAQAIRTDESHVTVQIGRSGATPSLKVAFRLDAQGKLAADYEYVAPPTTERPNPEPTASTLDFDLNALPTLEDAITGAVFIQSSLDAAVLDNYDHWGCDLLPGKWNGIASCGTHGRCCDTHDACYKKYGCTSKSWKSVPWSKCQLKCNIPAVACFLGPIAGPSNCCAKGNCGKPR